MRTREIARFRSVLRSQLTSLVGHGEAVVHELVGTGGEEIPDPNDRATREEGHNWSLRLGDRDRKLIAKIESALARIEDGSFGTCLSCGKAIDPARLRARPVTDLCIACKTEAEKSEQRHR
jgi:DnaK suppressor protein